MTIFDIINLSNNYEGGKFMSKNFKKIVNFSKGFVLKHSNLIAAIAFAVVIMDCNSTCCYLLGQPELPKGSEEFKKYA